MRGEEVIRRTGSNGRRSSCTSYGGLLYTSGITTVDLAADILGQAQDIFAQLDALMAYNNTNKNRILSANVTLRTMQDYGNFNAAWDLWVVDGFEPARNVVEGALPLDEYLLKISLIVALDE